MLYKAILKAFNSDDEIDIVLSNHMPGLERIYNCLSESNIFNKVFYFDDDLYQDYIKNEALVNYVSFPNILWAWPMKLRRYFKYQKEARKKELPDGLNLYGYDEILANDGVSTMNFKLNFYKIPYVVSEHGRGNFRIKVPLHILAVYLTIFLDRLNIIVAYSGSSKYVKAVEVDRNEDLVCYIKRKEIRECRINQLEERLSEEEKDKIYRIYAKAYGIPEKFDGEVNLLLTAPLAHDKTVATVKDQLNCYQDAVDQNCDSEKPLLIKPHPRDTVDYSNIFPDAIIIDKVVTSEVLSFCKSLKIDKVLTIYSTSISSFRRAKEMIVLGADFLDLYNHVSNRVGESIVYNEDIRGNGSRNREAK